MACWKENDDDDDDDDDDDGDGCDNRMRFYYEYLESRLYDIKLNVNASMLVSSCYILHDGQTDP